MFANSPEPPTLLTSVHPLLVEIVTVSPSWSEETPATPLNHHQQDRLVLDSDSGGSSVCL